MKSKRKHSTTMTMLICLVLVILLFVCCNIEPIEEEIIDPPKVSVPNPENWSDETHSKKVEPNYDIVFNQSEVMVMDIVITKKDWGAMQGNLAKDDWQTIQQNIRGAGLDTVFYYDPIWAEATISYNGNTWDHVGIRYKGNSSLLITYREDNNKLSFKLDFDEFEDDYPEIKNQRFYGFKQLNLNNNFKDQSLMREKVAADLFREFGLISAQTAFCVVNLDHGEGSQFYGLYTLVEEIDDSVIKTQTGAKSGNLYKPELDAASFAINTYDEEELNKKNNKEEANYADVAGLYDILNNNLRTSDTQAWKSDLEEVFNVDGYLKWLAANTVIQNWDTYGIMGHNYFLYNEPSTNQLNWIPWDNSVAFGATSELNSTILPLDFVGVSDEWPLINYIVHIPEYKDIYDAYLQEFIEEVYTVDKMTTAYNTYYELIKEYAYSEEIGYTFLKSDADFDKAIETLIAHVEERKDAVVSYLEE